MLRTEVITLIIIHSPVTWNKYQTDTTLEKFFSSHNWIHNPFATCSPKRKEGKKNASCVKNLDTEGSFLYFIFDIAYPSHSGVPDEAGIS